MLISISVSVVLQLEVLGGVGQSRTVAKPTAPLVPLARKTMSPDSSQGLPEFLKVCP